MLRLREELPGNYADLCLVSWWVWCHGFLMRKNEGVEEQNTHNDMFLFDLSTCFLSCK